MRIGVIGRGRMGSALAQVAGSELVWQVGRGMMPKTSVDVLVDVSVPSALPNTLARALELQVPLVIGTTGWTMPDLAERVGQRIGVVVAPNFSLTVALMQRLTRLLGRFAQHSADADPYVVEHHHGQKHDAPSGTARLLIETLLQACPKKKSWAFAPSDHALRPDQLCVASIRAGYAASSHVVAVDAPGETLELVHRARDLSVYAHGAMAAARWVRDQKGVHPFAAVAAAELDPLFQGV